MANVPDKFYLLADSNSSECEALVSEDGRILSFQFHPEYMGKFINTYSYRMMRHYGKVDLKKFEAKDDPE